MDDMIGQRFCRLTVLNRAGSQNHFATWRCRCDCGNEVVVRGNNLRSGNTSSCGCLFRETAAASAGRNLRRLREFNRMEKEGLVALRETQ